LDDNRNDLSLPLSNIQALREAARILNTRAYFHLGEERHAAAWRHAKATLDLARATAEGPYWVDQLVAAAIGGIGLDVVHAIVADDQLPPPTARKVFADLSVATPLTQMLRSTDQGERFFAINTILGMGSDTSVLSGWTDDSISEPLRHTRIDWNIALEDLNNRQDLVLAAARAKSWAARQAAFAAIDDADQTRGDAISNSTMLGGSLLGTRRRSRLMSDLINTGFMSSPSMVFAAEYRVAAQLQLTNIAAALAVHRCEQGGYPETLEALVPNLLPTKPTDTMHGKPIGYRRTDDGYLLYSCGPNGVDDGGSNEQRVQLAGKDVSGDNWSDADESDPVDPDTNEPLWQQIPAGADDISIRVPIPVEPWPWERPGR
ncbi:MAG: hypothetical protein AAGG46_08770, partial [Planctomycetota bacterium]